jgi:hypothetical protein
VENVHWSGSQNCVIIYISCWPHQKESSYQNSYVSNVTYTVESELFCHSAPMFLWAVWRLSCMVPVSQKSVAPYGIVYYSSVYAWMMYFDILENTLNFKSLLKELNVPCCWCLEVPQPWERFNLFTFMCCKPISSGILTILNNRIVDVYLNEFYGSILHAFPRNSQ